MVPDSDRGGNYIWAVIDPKKGKLLLLSPSCGSSPAATDPRHVADRLGEPLSQPVPPEAEWLQSATQR